MEDSGDPGVIAFLEQEKNLLSNRQADFAVTLVDSLFRFYGPAFELARETIESLYQFDPTNQLVKAITEQIKTHQEFELAGKVVPHIQMRFSLIFLLIIAFSPQWKWLFVFTCFPFWIPSFSLWFRRLCSFSARIPASTIKFELSLRQTVRVEHSYHR